jgi:hypothetical protein
MVGVSNRKEIQEFSWGIKDGRPARQAGNLTAICDHVIYNNIGASTSRSTMDSNRLLHE